MESILIIIIFTGADVITQQQKKQKL